jgi:precorrin-6A/cobalt-precorrin-6A reductase
MTAAGAAHDPAVLILGGTGEARHLAARLAARPGLRVVSSLAGRVRDPTMPAGEVRIGGFGGADGLSAWLTEQHITAVIDATHPFAEAISASAATASHRTGVPLLRVVRPQWTPGEGDAWHEASSLPEAASMLPGLGRRVFLTTGRQGLAAFALLTQIWFLIRCVDPPAGPVPPQCQVILARGPYDPGAERALMSEHRIDVLVTKNSGGGQTDAKLDAARDLGVPVLMIRRPPLPSGTATVDDVEGALEWIDSVIR